MDIKQLIEKQTKMSKELDECNQELCTMMVNLLKERLPLEYQKRDLYGKPLIFANSFRIGIIYTDNMTHSENYYFADIVEKVWYSLIPNNPYLYTIFDHRSVS